MRVQVNLATRPFVELDPFFLRLRLLMGALALAGLFIAVGAHLLSAKAERQQAELDQLRNQTIAAQQIKLRTEQRMRRPENAQILDRAHFLNTLFLRKSFSWTAVMMDLENVLPAGVQVTSIEPGISANGEVTIRLRVAGDRDRAVQLVRNLERSRRFLTPRLGSESSQVREVAATPGQRALATLPGVAAPPAGVEFEILALYNPLPAGEPYTAGHGRPAAAAHPAASAGVKSPSTSGPGVPHSGTSPAANARAGYPRNGVVLPPYTPPHFSGVQPKAGAQTGGPQ